MKFQIREASGGKGAYRGGDGVTREIRFLEKVELSLLTQRRKSGPYGMKGGGDGEPGEQYIIRKDGTKIPLGAVSSALILPGDSLLIETPGGGAWGNFNYLDT